MRKKLFTAAVAFALSALASNAFAFPTWQELRNEIINFGNRVVKQLNEMGFPSAKEVSNDVVEYTFGDTNIRISPQGYSIGSNQFIMFGTSFSARDFGVKPEKARKIVAEQYINLSCQTSRIVVSEDDGTVMIISMMPAKDQFLEEDLKRGLAAHSADVAATALSVKNAFKGK